jgi:bifunctional DNase/RNase
MIETTIDSVRVDLSHQRRVLLLKEVNGERHLPIWIGEFEASAIVFEMDGTATQRPLPYDLIIQLAAELDARIIRVVVNDLSRDIYYGRIVVDRGGHIIEIDARPSDAIAVAVRTNCPIYVDDAVMERAGIMIPDDDEAEIEVTPEGFSSEEAGPHVPEEGLTLFRDFINTLDVDEPDTRSS